MSNAIKNIAIIVGIIALCVLAYSYISREPETPAFDHIETAEVGALAPAATAKNPADEFAALLAELSKVDFQRGNSIFDNPIFLTGLASFRRDLPEIEQSRANPFAPLEGTPAKYIRYRGTLPAAVVPAATGSSAFPAAPSATSS